MPEPTVPRVTDAAYGGETITLEAGPTVLAIHRRTTGWGWAELSVDGRLRAVLDHFGELKPIAQVVPVRLEADRAEQLGPRSVRFDVRAVDLAERLTGTSFEQWVGGPLRAPVLQGGFGLELSPDGSVRLDWRLTAQLDLTLDYFRGPWLRVPDQPDHDHDDAVLPGIDWAIGEEWTSGTDFFRDPWAMRATPPPVSVTAPMVAVHRGDRTVSLEWDPNTPVTGWFSMDPVPAQPVLAAPNFIERRPGSLLGLMIPAHSEVGGSWHDLPPLELHRGQRIELGARVGVLAGTGLDALADWVGRHGMPDPGPPRWPLREAIERIAVAYAERFWRPGEGYGLRQVPGDVSGHPPEFVRQYLDEFPDTAAAQQLRRQLDSLADDDHDRQRLQTAADELITAQLADGSFAFDPTGLHRSKDDLLVARDLVAPMGQPGDRAVDLTMVPVLRLLAAAEDLGEQRYADAARRGLDAWLGSYRPEGGDYWETPLHAPNLLAAGHAALAYELGYRRFGEQRYRDQARHWLRTLLVFTQLWQPTYGPEMIFNTKPCLCASDWYFANWVRDHVQWEVLETFAAAARVGVDLAGADPDLDWHRYQQGICHAALRWLIDHRDEVWRPHNLPATIDAYRQGDFDLCLPDTHSSLTGRYGGMAIMPGTLGVNLLTLWQREAA